MDVFIFASIKKLRAVVAIGSLAMLCLAGPAMAELAAKEMPMAIDGAERSAQALPDARRVAAEAIGQALRLADLLDVARLGRPDANLDAALGEARELRPKPYMGMGEWESTANGIIVAPVGSPKLCAELAKQCLARPAEPGRCWCANRANGYFFAFDLPRSFE